MRYLYSTHVKSLLCFAAIASVTPANADTVNALPKSTLQQFVHLGLNDNTKVLAPARRAFEKNDIPECRRMLERAAAESGIVPHPEVQLASWYLSSGKTELAMDVAEKVALTEPDRPDVRWLFCEIARKQGRLFDAWTHGKIASVTKVPSRWEDQYKLHFKNLIERTLAMIADQRGDWKTSEKMFKEMFLQGTRTPEVDQALGRAAFFQDRPEEAFKFFKRASEAPGVDALPQLLMAALYEQKGNPEKTEEWFKKGDAAGKMDSERIRLEYARWLIRQNRSADAKKVATKFRPTEENRDDFEYMVALCERMDGNFEVAEKILSRLNLASPRSFAIANQLALLLVETKDQGKLGRAMQLAQTNVRNFPNSVDAISTFGWVQYRSGDVNASSHSFAVLLQRRQTSRDAAFYIAQVNYALDKKDVAEAFIKAAKESEGEFFNAFRVDEKL